MNRQLKRLRPRRASPPVRQIAGANEHVVTPKVARANPAHHERGDLELKCGGMVQVYLSPLITDVPMRKPASPTCRLLAQNGPPAMSDLSLLCSSIADIDLSRWQRLSAPPPAHDRPVVWLSPSACNRVF